MALNIADLTILARIAKSGDGKFVQRLVGEMLKEADEALRNAQGEEVFRAQGRAQAYDHLIKVIAQAPANLQRNEQSPSQAKRPVVDRSSAAVPYQHLS